MRQEPSTCNTETAFRPAASEFWSRFVTPKPSTKASGPPPAGSSPHSAVATVVSHLRPEPQLGHRDGLDGLPLDWGGGGGGGRKCDNQSGADIDKRSGAPVRSL